jgi:hypothetical protein
MPSEACEWCGVGGALHYTTPLADGGDVCSLSNLFGFLEHTALDAAQRAAEDEELLALDRRADGLGSLENLLFMLFLYGEALTDLDLDLLLATMFH